MYHSIYARIAASSVRRSVIDQPLNQLTGQLTSDKARQIRLSYAIANYNICNYSPDVTIYILRYS